MVMKVRENWGCHVVGAHTAAPARSPLEMAPCSTGSHRPWHYQPGLRTELQVRSVQHLCSFNGLVSLVNRIPSKSGGIGNCESISKSRPTSLCQLELLHACSPPLLTRMRSLGQSCKRRSMIINEIHQQISNEPSKHEPIMARMGRRSTFERDWSGPQ